MDKFMKTLIENQISKKEKRREVEDIVNNEEEELEEIVDEKGNIRRGKIPNNVNIKGVTQKRTTDQVVRTAYGQMGNTDGQSNRLTRYWGETDMSKMLGYKKTMGKDKDIDDAEDYFEKDLGLTDDETKEKLTQMGYDEKLSDGKLRLVENPKKLISQFIDELLTEKKESKSIDSILKKQLDVIKKTITKNNISINDITKYLEK